MTDEKDEDDDSWETLREEFDTAKICTNIKELNEEQKTPEDADKIIFTILGKSIGNYIIIHKKKIILKKKWKNIKIQ